MNAVSLLVYSAHAKHLYGITINIDVEGKYIVPIYQTILTPKQGSRWCHSIPAINITSHTPLVQPTLALKLEGKYIVPIYQTTLTPEQGCHRCHNTSASISISIERKCIVPIYQTTLTPEQGSCRCHSTSEIYISFDINFHTPLMHFISRNEMDLETPHIQNFTSQAIANCPRCTRKPFDNLFSAPAP